MNSRERPASYHLLRLLRDRGTLDDEAWREAVRALFASPDGATWLAMVRIASLGLAAVNLVGALIYALVLNWLSIGRFGQFAVAQGALFAAGALGIALGPRRLSGQLSITAAAALIGPTMVVTSLAYPPEGELWTLFTVWAVLAAPLVFGAGFGPLTIGWILLIDAAVVSGHTAFLPLDDLAPYGLEVFTVHMSAVAVWEVAGLVSATPRSRWPLRVVGTLGLIALCFSSIDAVLPWDTGVGDVVALIAVVVAVPVAQALWWTRARDLLLAAAAALVGILTLTAAALRLSFEALEDLDVLWSWPVIGLVLLVLTVLVVAWLRLAQVLWPGREP